ncbi:hypothetical protein QBC39DRAFT_383931 [Podospora conica]|nr:hypothetical protein QBC39DRAFT_383931 [Schizothecium conicum]
MKLSLAQALLALPVLTSGAVLPETNFNHTEIGEPQGALDKRVPPAGACHINSRQFDLWTEWGRNRWRTAFSASGIDPSTYCRFWRDGGNIQCGWDQHVEGGSWRIDASFDKGPIGDALYWRMLERSRENWRKEYGCTTG